jgi:hypothetical protein
MPGPITISDGGFCTQDNSEVRVYEFDYDTLNLAAGVQLASVGTFVITPTTPTALTQDNVAFVAGNRRVLVRLSGGTIGQTYKIEHTVNTNEAPLQTKSKWFRVRISA